MSLIFLKSIVYDTDMKKSGLVFAVFMAFFASILVAQTPVEERQLADQLTLRPGEREPLPPALTEGPEQFRRGAFWGWRKLDSVLVEPIFSRIEPFYSTKMVAKKAKMYGLIDERGREILPFEYTGIEKFRFQTDRVDPKNPPKWFWLRASKNYKMGLMDSLAQVIVPFEFDGASWSRSDTILILWQRGRQVFASPCCRKPLLETHFDSLSSIPLPVHGYFAPILADGSTALASYSTGKIEYEQVEFLSPTARMEFLEKRPDLPKTIEWNLRARRVDGRMVLMEWNGNVFELNE